MTEQAFHAAEIDLCSRRLKQTRAFQASMEGSEARSHAAYLKREAERQRELERGVHRTMPGWRPGYRGHRGVKQVHRAYCRRFCQPGLKGTLPEEVAAVRFKTGGDDGNRVAFIG